MCSYELLQVAMGGYVWLYVAMVAMGGYVWLYVAMDGNV